GAIGAPQPTAQVGSLVNGYPAQGVLKKGDRIISVDGQRGNQEKFSKAISAHKCAQQPPTNRCVAQTAALLKVQRNGQIVTVSIKPRYNAQEKRMLVGFGYALAHKSEGLGPALKDSGSDIFWAVVELFRRRPVAYSVMERAGVVGFMLVIALFFIGLTNDIGRINGGGF